MKYTSLFTLVVLMFLSCGGNEGESVSDVLASKDLKALRAKKKELTEEEQAISRSLSLLDSAIAALSPQENFPLVSTIQATPQEFQHYLELQGDVVTRQNVLVYPEMAGTLETVYVKEGQQVRKGQVLGRIDDGGLESQLQQLKSQAALAETTFERQKRLWDQKIGSEIQFLQAKTEYEARQKAVEQLQSQLAKSVLKAPFNGIVDDVMKDEGTVVSPGPGSEIFRVVNLSDMYIEVEIPERYLGDINAGKDARIYFPVLGDSIRSEVRTTGNFINPANRSFSAEIPVPNQKGLIKPNLTARVNINDYSKANAILIPQGIISENAEGQQYVYVIRKNESGQDVAVKTIITTGRTQGSEVEVLTGLKEADQIIREGARTVKDGQVVEILNP